MAYGGITEMEQKEGNTGDVDRKLKQSGLTTICCYKIYFQQTNIAENGPDYINKNGKTVVVNVCRGREPSRKKTSRGS
jgi:hypothetical protein